MALGMTLTKHSSNVTAAIPVRIWIRRGGSPIAILESDSRKYSFVALFGKPKSLKTSTSFSALSGLIATEISMSPVYRG
jgi:hypothetical protein